MAEKNSTLHLWKIWLDTEVFVQEPNQNYTATKAIA